MAALKPAFKAFVSILTLFHESKFTVCCIFIGDFPLLQDMQALINKINKSVVAPLPTMYSGAL
jgi:hypothetical protein